MTHELYLIAHIGLAVLSLSLSAVAGYQSIQQQIEKADSLLRTTWVMTLITSLSGIALSVIMGKSIVATCVSLAAFIGIIGAVHSYHVVRHKLSAS